MSDASTGARPDADTIAYLPEIGQRPGIPDTTPHVGADPEASLNRLCVLLSDAAGDIRTAITGLNAEAQAMGMALHALDRILDTLKTCSNRVLERFEEDGADRMEAGDLARPLRLAASTALAVNANIASSSNALAEASLRIIRAGENFIEASRLAAGSEARAGRGRVGARNAG